MKRAMLLASVALLTGADLPQPAPARPTLPAARLPGFAADLAQQPAITASTLSIDPVSGEKHTRHQMTKDGFYKGRLVIDLRKKEKEVEETSA